MEMKKIFTLKFRMPGSTKQSKTAKVVSESILKCNFFVETDAVCAYE